ncbi:MAG: hypothetical protein WD739_00320 [Actinomycetota bacterium]
MLDEFPQAQFSDTELEIDLDLTARSRQEAASEGLAHVFATLDRADLTVGEDISLETFGADLGESADDEAAT